MVSLCPQATGSTALGRVRLVFNPPEQPRENLILKDRPWEQGRVGGYAHVLKDGELYRMYYNSFDRSYQVRYLCLAVSSDGVRWTKPGAGLDRVPGNPEDEYRGD